MLDESHALRKQTQNQVANAWHNPRSPPAQGPGLLSHSSGAANAPLPRQLQQDRKPPPAHVPADPQADPALQSQQGRSDLPGPGQPGRRH